MRRPCDVCKRVHQGRCVPTDVRSVQMCITFPGRVHRLLKERVPWGERSGFVARATDRELGGLVTTIWNESDAAEFPDADRLAIRMDGRDALSEVYSGASVVDWDALVDHLEDRGLRVVRSSIDGR